MKKHLVIICGVMYPDASATGVCAKRIAEFLSNDYEIDMICVASDMNAATVQYKSGIKIYALAGGTLRKEMHSKGLAKRISHFCGQMQILTRFLGNMEWFSAAAYQKIEEINRSKKVDAVFSVCSPISAHFAASMFKKNHPGVRWVAYTVDLYSIPERIRPLGYSLQALSEKEQITLQGADSVLLSEEIYTNHPEIVKRLKVVDILPYVIPEREEIDIETKLLNRNNINCVFAGSFYRDLRNPECMLDMFGKLKDDHIKLHLFSTGCDEVVEKYALKCSSIISHGRISYEEIQKVYFHANVLVNIGNANSDFIPSKTFEYIATGKPIVNFYYGNEPDVVLNRYSLAFHIHNGEPQGDCLKLEKFLLNNKSAEMPREKIERLYPENTIGFVENLLKSKIG